MTTLHRFYATLREKWKLTPEQAETLASIKFPCC